MAHSMQTFADLKDKVIFSVQNDDDQIVFVTMDGWEVSLCHPQDCCESVRIEDITGDLHDLVGQTILMAEETTNEDERGGHGSGMWTFYRLASVKGYVTIRWYGTSNGYYSVSVQTYWKKLGPPEPVWPDDEDEN